MFYTPINKSKNMACSMVYVVTNLRNKNVAPYGYASNDRCLLPMILNTVLTVSKCLGSLKLF